MIRTPEFRRWFRNSKIVDERGEPLVVYHGGFDVLNSRAGSFRRSAAGALGAGIYFTPDRSVAEYYAGSQGGHAETGGGALTEVYLSIQNPLVVSHASGHDPAIAALVLLGEPRARAEAKVERARERYGDVGKTIENAAVKADYDGILHYIDGALYEIVAFQPGQVKSATRNAGTYEFFDPDIRRNPDAFGPKERPANTSLMYDALHAAAGSALRAWMDAHHAAVERAGRYIKAIEDVVDSIYENIANTLKDDPAYFESPEDAAAGHSGIAEELWGEQLRNANLDRDLYPFRQAWPAIYALALASSHYAFENARLRGRG